MIKSEISNSSTSNFCESTTAEECSNFADDLLFLKSFTEIYNKEKQKLPYHINIIDVLHTDENAHSRILEKLLKQKTHNGGYEILTSFVEYLKNKGIKSFAAITVENPRITQEAQRIDLWIRDNSYAIIIENKIHWASDQNKQIERYIDKTKENKFTEEQIFVVYLSPTYEKEPSRESWGKYFDSDIYKSRYLRLSFRNDILVWLKEEMLPNVKIKDAYLRSAIEQYIDHLDGVFNLRKINKNMNMELQKFIKEKLGLQDDKPENAIVILSEKEKELNNVICQIQQLKKVNIKNYFEKLEKSLQANFPNLKIVSNKFKLDKYIINVGVEFSVENQNFVAIIEGNNRYSKPYIYFGVRSQVGRETPPEKLQKILDGNELKSEDPWCGRKGTSFENGYKRFGDLIKDIIAI
jgi:hypothetical protein